MKKNLGQKILLVGERSLDPQVYAYADSLRRVFADLGYEVMHFNNKPAGAYIASRLKKKIVDMWVNFRLIMQARKFSPNVIFVVKGENLWPATLSFLGRMGVQLINFYPDNPFLVSNGNSNANVLHALPIYHVCAIWSKMLMPVMSSIGCRRVEYMPFGYESALFGTSIFQVSEKVQKFTYDVCFAGTWEPDRQWWLEQLVMRMPHLKLAIWGNMWHEHLAPDSPLRKYIRGNAVYGAQMIQYFRESKIVLNLVRKQNLSAHNMRTFEIPASEAFQLAQRTKEHCEVLFTEGQSIACFATPDELETKIMWYLAHENERELIRLAGIECVKKMTLERIIAQLMGSLDGDNLHGREIEALL